MRVWLTCSISALFLALPLAHGAVEIAQTTVDLALVLAVDVSQSMDPDEQRLQRDGYVEAFQSPLVHEAIGAGTLGRIAVVYVEWAAADEQRVIVPWTVIGNGEDAAGFADQLAREPIHRLSRTSISAAVDFGAQLLASSGITAERMAIDISGDGPNNHGRPLAQAREDALMRGITINGLPIMKGLEAYDIQNLDLYFRDCVIGGPGAFMIPVRERGEFAEATRAKLVREVSDRPVVTAPKPANEAERIDCQAIEKLQ